MSKVTILIPITVEADVEPLPQADESLWNCEKTDFFRLKNIQVENMIVPASAVAGYEGVSA